MHILGKNTASSIECMASLLILGGVLPLVAAVIAQYALHLFPCHFCMLQRYPYVLVIACGALSLCVPRMSLPWRLCVAFGLCGWLITGTLGLIHGGIEADFLRYTGGCVAIATDGASLEALRTAIFAAPLVSCKDVQAEWLGLSMALWNALFAFTCILVTLLQYRHERRHHAP